MNHEFCYGVNVATTAAAYCRFVCTLGAGFIFIFLNFLYLVLNFTSTSSGIKGIKAYTFSCMLKEMVYKASDFYEFLKVLYPIYEYD